MATGQRLEYISFQLLAYLHKYNEQEFDHMELNQDMEYQVGNNLIQVTTFYRSDDKAEALADKIRRLILKDGEQIKQ